MDSDKTCGCSCKGNCKDEEVNACSETKTEESSGSKEDQIIDEVVISRLEYQNLLDAQKNAQQEVQKAKQEVLYLHADLENFKKRQQKTTADQVCYANERFIRELIPVIDNFSLALKHIDQVSSTIENKEIKNLVKGVELITKQFSEVLCRFGVEEVKSLGSKFDPNFHEAVDHKEVEDSEPDSVVTEFQKGYMLNGRLIRPAKVCVSKNNKEQK